MSEVVRNRAVYLLKRQCRKAFSRDRFGGNALLECNNYRIERHASAADPIASVALFDVVISHGMLPELGAKLRDPILRPNHTTRDNCGRDVHGCGQVTDTPSPLARR